MEPPLVAFVPKDHGTQVPESFLRKCEETVALFRKAMESDPARRDEAAALARTAEAFTWFLMDTRELGREPATVDELKTRFKAWMHANVKHGAPPEDDVARQLDVFVGWVEQRKVASVSL